MDLLTVHGLLANLLAMAKKSWRDTDAVEGHTVFNIKGNSYRLISQINYRSQTLVIEHVLTHAEYDKEKWKK